MGTEERHTRALSSHVGEGMVMQRYRQRHLASGSVPPPSPQGLLLCGVVHEKVQKGAILSSVPTIGHVRYAQGLGFRA